MRLLKYLIILLMFVKMGFNTVQSQIDSVFWFAAPWVTPDHDGNVQLAFRVSTFGAPATVRMQLPANGFDTTFVVPANSLANVPLDYLVNSIESKPADALLTSGFKITSDELITVVYDFISDLIVISPGTPNNPETYSLKGQNGMGNEFVVPFQTLWNNRLLSTDRNGDGFVTQPKQFFSVVATEDNTTIYITPNCDVIGHPADITYSYFLPFAGNVYTCENAVLTTSNPGSSLSGSIVVSDKPVSVTINDDSVNPSGGGGCFDLMGDQIVPTDVIGNEYIVNKGFLNAGSDESFFIIPAENFTTITVDDGTSTTQLLNQGETWQYSVTQALTYISSDKPVYLIHMSGYGCELGLAILPPLNCAGSDEVSFARNNDQQFLLNILCAAGDENSFTFTGPGTATVPAPSFAPVPGTGGAWVGAQIDYSTVEIPSGTQNTITNSAGFFSLGVINGGPSTGCLYHYMSSFHRKVLTDAGNNAILCNGEEFVNLSGSVTGGSTSGVWTVLDGTGTLNDPTLFNTTYEPTTNDYGQGYLTFVLSSTGNCEPVRDTMKVTFIQSPIVDAGTDDSYCKNNIGAVPLVGNLLFAAGATWSGGNGGSFGNPGSLTTSYTPSPTDIAQDSVILYLTSAGSFFSCPDDEDTVVIYFTEAPQVIAGIDIVLCSNETLFGLNGSVTGLTSTGDWTISGTGAFSTSASDLNADYLISTDDVTAGNVVLTLTSTNNGNCLAEKDSIQLTFLSEPVVQITSIDSVCSNTNLLNLNGTLTLGYSPTWTTTGFGSIVAPGTLSTQYNITPVDTAAGFIDVFLESNAGICPVEQDSMRIYFVDPPKSNAGTDQDFCSNEVVQLNGVITGINTNGTWTTMGTGVFTPSNNILVTNYVPSALDVSNGAVNLILTATSVFGCVPDNDVVTITFKSPPNADFTGTTVCLGQNTVFADNSSVSSGILATWDWEFGDAITSIAQNPTHTYSGYGNYSATLIASGDNGCFDTITKIVIVDPVPIADVNFSLLCENEPVLFNDASFIPSGSISGWLYDFGSSTFVTQSATYTFPSSGAQSFTFTATSNLGCTDDTTFNINVNPSPNADFTFTPNPALVLEDVIFTDQSQGNQLSGWLWDFGDNEGDNAQNPVHGYTDGGDYYITLIVTDVIGCQDSVTKLISVALPPVLPSGFSPNGDSENDVFIIRGGPFNEVDFKVYNNWGELIFTSTDAAIGWDGTFNGELAPIGVYTWTFVVQLANGVLIKESGDVTLIR